MQYKNNIYLNAQGANSSEYVIARANTDATLINKNFINPLNQIPFKWNTEEIVYEASDIDTPNGQWDFYQNGVLASDQGFISRTTERPGLYDTIYQSQVSNGALPGSVVYYDSLYIDDSWHRVVICSSGTYDKCTNREIQIPTGWNENEITVRVTMLIHEYSQHFFTVFLV